MAKVGKGMGMKGFADSKGSTGPSSRVWDEGEYLLEIESVSQKATEDGFNVMVKTKCLGGQTQSDDTDPEGKNITIFINVNVEDENMSFTIDQLKDLFLVTKVKTTGDDPEPFYPKLKGKKFVGYAVVKAIKSGKNAGKPRNNWYIRSLEKSRNFASSGEED
jgi:hypothetical protein